MFPTLPAVAADTVNGFQFTTVGTNINVKEEDLTQARHTS